MIIYCIVAAASKEARHYTLKASAVDPLEHCGQTIFATGRFWKVTTVTEKFHLLSRTLHVHIYDTSIALAQLQLVE